MGSSRHSWSSLLALSTCVFGRVTMPTSCTSCFEVCQIAYWLSVASMSDAGYAVLSHGLGWYDVFVRRMEADLPLGGARSKSPYFRSL